MNVLLASASQARTVHPLSINRIIKPLVLLSLVEFIYLQTTGAVHAWAPGQITCVTKQTHLLKTFTTETNTADMIPDCFHLIFVLASLSRCLFTVTEAVTEETGSEKYIIKDCNGIQYRLMVDLGSPPFPETACDVKKVSKNAINSLMVYRNFSGFC